MNIYDFIDNPFNAIRGGYNPCYLTKVSFIINAVYSLRWFRRAVASNSSFGLNQTVIDNIIAMKFASVWIVMLITMPVLCWFVALLPIGGKHGTPSRNS